MSAIKSKFSNAKAPSAPVATDDYSDDEEEKVLSNPARAALYGGHRARAGRMPQLTPHAEPYRVRMIKTYETMNPRSGEWFHAQFEVLGGGDANAHPPGSTAALLQSAKSTSISAGGPEVKAMTMAFMGLDEESYDEFDPKGRFLGGCVAGHLPSYTSPQGDKFEANPLADATALVTVSRGKPHPKIPGEYFRYYTWAVDEEESSE